MHCGRWTIIGGGLLLLCLLLVCGPGYAEDAGDAMQPAFSTSLQPVLSAGRPVRLEAPRPHLLDLMLYGGIGSYRAFDYASTRHALAAGARETVLPQWVVNSHGTFIAFEGLASSVEIGGSLWLIRRGHRRVARAMNLFSIGLGTKTIVHNYSY